jgi:hypothetical protein
MNIRRPQDENGIVAMILRDINNVLRETPNFDFSLAARTKTIKVIFTIAEQLDIPITRSWYRHGGNVHSQIIKLNPMSREIRNLNGVTEAEIETAEQYMKPYESEYETLLHSIVPKYFFMSLPALLTLFYQNAPEIYQPLYFSNLEMFKTFRKFVMPTRGSSGTAYQQVISKFATQEGNLDFGYYKSFSNILSRLSFEMSALDNFSKMHPYLSQFTDIFEDYLVKASYEGELKPQVFSLFQQTYEQAVWFPSSRIISLNTAKGTMDSEVKRWQIVRLTAEIPQITSDLQFLKQFIESSKMVLSLDERTRFFNTQYGNDTEVLGAIADAWRNYKEPVE